MIEHKCFKAGCRKWGAYGLRMPGPRREQPTKWRDKYIWHCEDHAPDAHEALAKVARKSFRARESAA